MPKDFSAQKTFVQQYCYSIAQLSFIAVLKVERRLPKIKVPM